MKLSRCLSLVFVLACAGCQSKTADNADAGASHAGSGGSKGGDNSDGGGAGSGGGKAGASGNAAADGGNHGLGGGGVGGSGSGAGGHSGTGGAGGTSASQDDGGMTDAGTVLHGTGSCCAVQTTPGCGNADLEVCVCEKDPTCCSKAWGQQCVFLVQQKYCQAGVRDCVCGTGSGQWGQTSCCDTDWTSTCDVVAQSKCNAVPGCF